jgi:hypothetical protein
MKKVYDFSKGKRGAVVPTSGKTRITIYVDDAVIKRFKVPMVGLTKIKSFVTLNVPNGRRRCLNPGARVCSREPP